MSVFLSVVKVAVESAFEAVDNNESLVVGSLVSLVLSSVFNSSEMELNSADDTSVDVPDEAGSSVNSSHSVAVNSADTSMKYKENITKDYKILQPAKELRL